MKIALFTYSTKPRGSVIHTLELARALTELGHRVTVFALDKDGKGFEQQLSHPVRLVPARSAPEQVEALIRQRIQEFVDFLAIENETFDIYHAQDCIGANALLELRERSIIPHFGRTVHHVEDFQSPYLRKCQEQSIRQPNLCLCVSRGWQQILKIDYGVDASLVFNGINLARFSAIPDGNEPGLKKRYGLAGWPIFLTVGGIEPRKNSIGLLQAFAQVLTTHPQAQLVIAGGATLFDYRAYRDIFFHKVESLGIEVSQSLILPGVIPAADLPGLYRCADVFCFPSHQEGWGLVVMEAIASGLPTIVSNQPPFTEFLAHNHTLWADPKNPGSIAAAMLNAIGENLGSLVQSGQTVLSQYSWQHSAQLHENQYQRLLNTYSKPEPGRINSPPQVS